MYRKPSPARVAVFAFYSYRYDIPEDMERQSNRHKPHPLSGGVTNRLPLVQRPALFYTLRRYLSNIRSQQ